MPEPEQVAAEPIPGEPVWDSVHRKEVTIKFISAAGHEEQAYLGKADRPSEVVRLFRQAAADTEFVIRQALERRTP